MTTFQGALRAVLAILAAMMAIVITPASIAQEPARLALLIGNKGYTAKVGPLKNPHRDVDLVEASLKRLGFRVTVIKDATYKQMDTALKRYVTDVRRAGKGALSFFYYSGHGVANPENGLNYLIPVDVADADDDKVWIESVQQNVVIDMLSKQAPGATHYLVFDACRNELNVTGANAKALGTDKGFVPVADTAGLLIAYATAPKRTASDAGEGGGPYAKVLAEELVQPGVESVTMFRNVQIRVKQSIGQDPWLSFPSLPPVYLAGRPEATPPAKQPEPPLSAAAREWQDVKGLSNRAVLEAFRKRHERDPVYAALADDALARLPRVPSNPVSAGSPAGSAPQISKAQIAPVMKSIVTYEDRSIGLVRSWRQHSDGVHAIAFSPDASSIASLGRDDVLNIWDIESGKRVATLPKNVDGTGALAFSAQEPIVAAGSKSSSTVIWNFKTSAAASSLTKRRDEIEWRIGFGLQDSLLVTASLSSLAIWNVAKSKIVREWKVAGDSTSTGARKFTSPYSMTISADGAILAFAGTADSGWGDVMVMLDIASLNELHAISVDSPYAAAFSPDGKFIAVGSWRGIIQIFEVSSGKLVREFAAHDHVVWGLRYSPDGKWLGSASTDKSAKLWEAATGRLVRKLEAKTHSVWSIDFSPDGRFVATGDCDRYNGRCTRGSVKLWDLKLLTEPRPKQ